MSNWLRAAPACEIARSHSLKIFLPACPHRGMSGEPPTQSAVQRKITNTVVLYFELKQPASISMGILLHRGWSFDCVGTFSRGGRRSETGVTAMR